MTAEQKGWRALPPALLFGAALSVVWQLISLVNTLARAEFDWSVRMGLADNGVSLATLALIAFGSWELQSRLAGREARGMRVAAIVWSTALGLMLVFQLLQFKQNLWEHRWVFKVYQWSWWLVWMSLPIALATAVAPKLRGVAIAMFVVAVLRHPPELFAKELYGWMHSFKAYMSAATVLRIAETTLFVVLAASLARGETSPDLASASSGFRRCANALWYRVIAAVTVTGITLLAVMGKGEGGFKLIKFSLMAGLVVNFVAFAVFGLGALRTARSAILDLPRWPLVVGAAASLFCAGVQLDQMPETYKLLYGGDSLGLGFGAERSREYLEAFTVILPLVAIASVVAVATALGGFANRRGLAELAMRASGKCISFVALMLVSMAIQSWLLPEAKSQGGAVFMMIGAAACALAAQVSMANLFTAASSAVESEPGIPKATVVSGPT